MEKIAFDFKVDLFLILICGLGFIIVGCESVPNEFESTYVCVSSEKGYAKKGGSSPYIKLKGDKLYESEDLKKFKHTYNYKIVENIIEFEYYGYKKKYEFLKEGDCIIFDGQKYLDMSSATYVNAIESKRKDLEKFAKFEGKYLNEYGDKILVDSEISFIPELFFATVYENEINYSPPWWENNLGIGSDETVIFCRRQKKIDFAILGIW